MDRTFIAKHHVSLGAARDYCVAVYADRTYILANANNAQGHWSNPKVGSRRWEAIMEVLRSRGVEI